MKKMKTIAVLAIFLAAALFVGAAAAIDVSIDASNPTEITIAGSYDLTYGHATIPGHYMPPGNTSFTVFDGLTADLVTGEFVLANANNGAYQQPETTNIATYQLNYVGNPADATENFVSIGGDVYQRNISANTPATLRFPDATFVPVDTVFTDGTIDEIVTANGGVIGYPAGTVLDYTISAVTVTYYLNVDIPVGPAPGTADRGVALGDDAFVFEKINVTGYTGWGIQRLIKYDSGATPSAINVIPSDANGVFNLIEDVVKGQYGTYYLNSYGGDFINIWYPEISLAAELAINSAGASKGDSIDGTNVNKDTVVSFLISAPKVGPAFNATGTPATAKIVFTTPVAGKTTSFGTKNFNNRPLATTRDLIDWTAAGDNAAAGTYTAQAEYVTPACFANYAKKSTTITFTLQSPTLTITAAKDSVIRSNPFTVTITGKALTDYRVFLENAADNEVNPTLQPNQGGLVANTNIVLSNSVIGAVFKTDASGKRTIQYNTASSTEEKTYTVRVEALDRSEYDTAKVKVEAGAVTITASGDGSYFIGDEITLSGTNTDSSNVFLFITGQNLMVDGIVLKSLPDKVRASNATNPVAVKTDSTWEYKWDTSQCALDTGAYTIYATSRLTNGKASDEIGSASSYATNGLAVKLSDSKYATVSVNLKQPFLSAVPSSSVIAQGDTFYVRGTAEGKPNNLKLYIFGPNFFEDYTITVEDDGTYERKIDISSSMSANQYFVVVQHPMYNGVFDAQLNGSRNAEMWFEIISTTTGHSQQSSFVVWGANKLQGSQAADALTKMIDDANIDDIYTKLTFTVAAPWIRIVNPGDQATGSRFTITGTTNLAVDDQILVEVVSSSFNAVDKTSTSTNSGISQTTKVVVGEGVDNEWSVEVDTTNWKLDQYTIKVSGIEVGVTTTADFNLVEKVEPTPTETGTGTTPTTVPPTTPTTPPTPGFGAFVALAGLGAVALLVLRRN